MIINRQHTRLADEKGFTLIEVLTVAAMIAILATVALASMHRSREAAYEAQAIGALRTLASMEYVYFFRHKEFGSWNELKAEGDLVDTDYTKADNLGDPYDHPIVEKYSLYMAKSTNGQDFTIHAIPMTNPHYKLRSFSIYGDGAVYGASFNLNPTPF